MENIYLTKNINEKLDLRILSSITALLKRKIHLTKRENLDHFQIFEVKDNKLIHSQEIPEQLEEYDLVGNFKNVKVWAIEGRNKEQGTYWTIMFPEDY